MIDNQTTNPVAEVAAGGLRGVKRQEFYSERCSNYQRKRRRANRKFRDRDNKKRREAYERNAKP